MITAYKRESASILVEEKAAVISFCKVYTDSQYQIIEGLLYD